MSILGDTTIRSLHLVARCNNWGLCEKFGVWMQALGFWRAMTTQQDGLADPRQICRMDFQHVLLVGKLTHDLHSSWWFGRTSHTCTAPFIQPKDPRGQMLRNLHFYQTYINHQAGGQTNHRRRNLASSATRIINSHHPATAGSCLVYIPWSDALFPATVSRPIWTLWIFDQGARESFGFHGQPPRWTLGRTRNWWQKCYY